MDRSEFSRQLPLALITKIQRRNSLRSRFALFLAQPLESRVLADLIPDRVDLQQCWGNHVSKGYLQQPLENGNRVISIAQQSVDLCRGILLDGALEWIFGSRLHGHGFLSF